jgi:hypothetical protein
MRRTIIALLLMVIIMVPFLSSCDSGDLQLLVDYAKMWAMVHGLTDSDGSVNLGAAARYSFGIGSTGDEVGDAVVDSGRTLKHIREAQKEADKGWKALTEGDPQRIKYDVYPHYNEAIRIRPDDWTFYNERAIAYLEEQQNLNGAKLGQVDFDKAAALARKSGNPEEYLRMLKHREQSLATFVEKERSMGAWLMGDVFRAQISTYDELIKLTGDKSYVLLKQQAESNLQSPHAERWDGK